MKIIKRIFLDNADYPEYCVLDANPQTREEAVNAVKEDIIEEVGDDIDGPTSFDELLDSGYECMYDEVGRKMILFDDYENNNMFEYFITK